MSDIMTDAVASAGTPCQACATTAQATYVYVIGRIEPRIPRAAVEKELVQATTRSGTNGLTDRAILHAVLDRRENRYLARKLCWVLRVQGLETYLLKPADAAEIDLLIDAVRPRPSPLDVDVVMGVRGGLAAPELCNGLMLPMITFDTIYSFDRPALIGTIPLPEGSTAEAFAPMAEELLERILQITDNAGASDEDRAINYLAVRYPAIYALVAAQHAGNASLSGIEVRPSSLSGARRIVECIFAFRNRATDVGEKFFTRVDVSEEFPFLVTKLQPYYERV
ncbi:hypothetical protein [Rhodopila sp.]|uniref:cyanobactin maturation protease PatG family protein n=1 Tax=Rhodopila sp. TaxID=2480087 RepID=UPI003D097652